MCPDLSPCLSFGRRLKISFLLGFTFVLETFEMVAASTLEDEEEDEEEIRKNKKNESTKRGKRSGGKRKEAEREQE